MQVRLQAWTGSLLRTYAVVLALVELAAPLVLSLIVLMPYDTWQLGAIITGGVGLVASLMHPVILWSTPNGGKGTKVVDTLRKTSTIDTARVIVGTLGSTALFTWLLVSGLGGYDIVSVAWICLWLVVLGITESFVFLTHWR